MTLIALLVIGGMLDLLLGDGRPECPKDIP